MQVNYTTIVNFFDKFWLYVNGNLINNIINIFIVISLKISLVIILNML
jgi:hypothetical protein